MSIGENIKKFRKEKGFTQKQLAQEIDKKERTVQKYEANEVTPPIDVIIKIGEILGVSTTLLINDMDYTNIDILRKKTDDAMMNEIRNTVDKKTSIQATYSLQMKELYEKYFFDLFFWKTSTMNQIDYFKFILSIAPLDENKILTNEDVEELSNIFFRLLQFKNLERHSINETTKKIPNYDIKKFEANNFLRTNR